MDQLTVTPALSIPTTELELTFARGGGPGGQNVNKVNSKVVLRFKVSASPTLSPEQKALILGKAPPRYLTNDGELVIAAGEHRDQAKNREAAEMRLVMVLRECLARPKTRRHTKPGKGAKARRLDSKDRESKKKAGRRGWDD